MPVVATAWRRSEAGERLVPFLRPDDALTMAKARFRGVGEGALRPPCPPPVRSMPRTTAQLALRPRKAGMSRTFSSIELRTGEDRPYGSRPCGADLLGRS